jgi:hypothetical protein
VQNFAIIFERANSRNRIRRRIPHRPLAFELEIFTRTDEQREERALTLARCDEDHNN